MRYKCKKRYKWNKDGFTKQVEVDEKSDRYLTSEHSWSPIEYAQRNGIHQRKDLIQLYKNWFLSGKDMYVNGAASGRIVLKYYPELLHLLKIGFIEQVRYMQYPHKKRLCEGKISKKMNYCQSQTVLRLKVK